MSRSHFDNVTFRILDSPPIISIISIKRLLFLDCCCPVDGCGCKILKWRRTCSRSRQCHSCWHCCVWMSQIWTNMLNVVLSSAWWVTSFQKITFWRQKLNRFLIVHHPNFNEKWQKLYAECLFIWLTISSLIFRLAFALKWEENTRKVLLKSPDVVSVSIWLDWRFLIMFSPTEATMGIDFPSWKEYVFKVWKGFPGCVFML